jgi:hypothetical protein
MSVDWHDDIMSAGTWNVLELCLWEDGKAPGAAAQTLGPPVHTEPDSAPDIALADKHSAQGALHMAVALNLTSALWAAHCTQQCAHNTLHSARGIGAHTLTRELHKARGSTEHSARSTLPAALCLRHNTLRLCGQCPRHCWSSATITTLRTHIHLTYTSTTLIPASPLPSIPTGPQSSLVALRSSHMLPPACSAPSPVGHTRQSPSLVPRTF